MQEGKIIAKDVWQLPNIDGVETTYSGLGCLGNGRYASLAATRPDLSIEEVTTRHLVILDATSRKLEKLKSTKQSIYTGLATSPDGRMIAYGEEARGGGQSYLSIIDIESGDVKSMTISGLVAPTNWLSEENSILITKQVNDMYKVIALNVQSNSEKELAVGRLGFLYEPTKTLVFLSSDNSAVSFLALITGRKTSIKGFAKDLIGVDKSGRAVLVVGIGYQDHFLLQGSTSAKPTQLHVPGDGEIRGVCLSD